MRSEWRLPMKRMAQLLFGIMREIPVLGEHSIQVAKISALMGREMNLSMERIVKLYVLGGLHDIGLIAPKIRNREIFEVLEKRGDRIEAMIEILKDDVVFKDHGPIGARIVSMIPFLSELSDVVYHHHTPAVDLEINLVTLMANIVMAADAISSRLMLRGDTPDRDFVHDIEEHIKTGKILYFPDVREAALGVIKKEGHMMLAADDKLHWEEFVGVEVGVDSNDFASVLAIVDFLVDSKASKTKHHSTRVAFLAREIGKEMLSTAESFGLFLAGRLHDVGKIFLPRNVLENRNRSKDFVYRTHVIHTYNLLSETETFQSIIAWAISHHERLDGSGYPWGLKKSEMSIPARILQVANEYVASFEDGAEDPLEEVEKCVRDGKLDGNVFLILKDILEDGYDLSEVRDVVEMYMEEVESGE